MISASANCQNHAERGSAAASASPPPLKKTSHCLAKQGASLVADRPGGNGCQGRCGPPLPGRVASDGHGKVGIGKHKKADRPTLGISRLPSVRENTQH